MGIPKMLTQILVKTGCLHCRDGAGLSEGSMNRVHDLLLVAYNTVLYVSGRHVKCILECPSPSGE